MEVSPTGFKRWLYRYTVAGKTTEIALGRGHSLERARELAEQQRKLLREGIDPVAERRRAMARAPVPTFAALTAEYIERNTRRWKSPVHQRQWRVSLEHHAGHINGMLVDRITVADVVRVLEPIWETHAVTASRIRGRIAKVLDRAKAQGHRTGDNPAAWAGNLDHLLEPQTREEQAHHAALKYEEMPEFFSKLRERQSVTHLLLEFVILTATRSTEARCIRWDEVDFASAVWTLPKERTKSGRGDLPIPLSARCIEILQTMRAARVNEFVFSASSGGCLSPRTLNAAVKRLGYDCTVHGMRSSFRDFAGDCTDFPRDVAEFALGHSVGDAVELAYRRQTALEKRRRLMSLWAEYCEGRRDNVVVPFGKASA